MDGERVRDISEFDLIQRLDQSLPDRARMSANLHLAIGDDCAVAGVTPGEMVVVTTDTLNDGVHFRFEWTTWENLGHKAVAVNLSDLAAMGAVPLLLTVSLALTGDELVCDLEQMYIGMGKLAASHQAVIAGGDVTRSIGRFSMAVTAIGETRSNRLLRRDEAQPHDLIWVTGSIGAAAAGLELEMLPESDPRKRAATATGLRNALHCPDPRVKAGRVLASLGVRCAMDLSDGLAGDLAKILAASNVDAEISLPDLPIAAAVQALFREYARDLALHGGEDYELLFTAPSSFTHQIREGFELIGIRASVIGQIRARAGDRPRLVGVEAHGLRHEIEPRGFDHFRAH
jgi:thiamine-monophosphate kinase